MSDSTFNIERATNGLVLALFLASVFFLAAMLYFVLEDMDERKSKPSASDAQAALVRTVPAPASHAPGGHASRSDAALLVPRSSRPTAQ